MRSLHHRPRPRFRLVPLVVAAFCAAAGVTARAQLAPGALPTGWNVTSGTASIVQNGSTLNIHQTTSQALVNFATFNVGAGALVDIRQPGSSAALLARTTGGDPSQIYGQIKANGALWLINPAGIMVGAGARIDVGSFIASTLNVSDSDFLAGRLTFKAGAVATPGDVRNAGTITAASGGSIYLVAPNVSNTGTLNAPNGEVLLAAGQSVQLVDTGTPGVSVAITGAPGAVTNLGRIAAEAGRIGLAAGLVTNGGSINADSVVREGGRVFLRASGDLKTTSASDISANGNTGGNVVLYADGAAFIDGRVSATGSAGRGGYVDTSGQRALDVVNVPVVGRGGEWHIDPISIQIVAGGGSGGTTGTNAITSNETGAHIGADVITAQLDAGTDVSITTGINTSEAGDITVLAAIDKTGSLASALTLNASNNIVISAPITSKASALTLNLNSNQRNDDTGADHAVQLGANLDLHGGVLTVSENVGGNGNGTLNIVSGTTSLNAPTSAINAATVNVQAGATLALNREGSALSGVLNNAGTVAVAGTGTGTALLDHGGTHTGVFDVAVGSGLSFSGGHDFNAGSAFSGGGVVEWADLIGLGTSLSFGGMGGTGATGANTLVLHGAGLRGSPGSVLTTEGTATVVDSQVALYEGTVWKNNGSIDVRGDGAISAAQSNTRFENNGTVTTSGTFANVLTGSSSDSTIVNNGTLIKNAAVDQQYTNVSSSAGSTVRVDAGELRLQTATLGGNLRIADGAHATLDGLTLGSGVAFSGAGTMTWQGAVKLLGDVDIAATAPVLSGGPLTFLQGNGHAFTTRNQVNLAGNANWVLTDGTTWNNYGAVNVGLPGGVGPGTLALQGSGAFNNKAGGVLSVAPASQLQLAATSVITNDAGATLQLTLDGSDSREIFRDSTLGRLLNSGTVVKTGIGATDAPLSNLAGGTVRIEAGMLGVRMGADNPNNGTVVLLPGGTLRSGGTDLYNNGVIAGSGTIGLADATLFNNGTVAPGSATALGTLAVQGSYVQGANGVLNIRLGSDGADLLDVDGAATLGGTLNLGVLGGFMPVNGAMADFVVARGPGSGGAFAQVNAPALASAGSTGTLSVSYPAGGATVARATAAVLPTLAQCVVNSALPGCTVVLPSLSACSDNAALPGCAIVLPTLAQCVANSALPGCNAVLPTPGMCTVSPLLQGCPPPPLPVVVTPPSSTHAPTPAPAPTPPPLADICTIAPNSALCQVLSPPPPVAVAPPAPTPAPPPSADICTFAPNSALCQVLSPPTASEPVKPVQQATNVIIATVTGTPSTLDTSETFLPAATGPAKKMYCN
ncbi:filamentous hemagglutinin N-terminal domain-containing protein [Variovorax sp. H27-G14]|uniref:beta strand repeat-containing protein n=1 Tax=Variovorax sp. H27-G14 TaxID=3111914 RepID=UPI0038FC4D98